MSNKFYKISHILQGGAFTEVKVKFYEGQNVTIKTYLFDRLAGREEIDQFLAKELNEQK